MADDRFPSLYDIEPPEGAAGWEELYNWYHLLGDERRESDEQRFWFQDRLHHPEVMHPYDEIQCECWWQALGAFNTRIFAMPPAYGVDQRVVNGYLYISPIPAPPEDIEARAAAFGERAGHYYEQLGRDLRGVEGQDGRPPRADEGDAVRAAPRPRGHEPRPVASRHVERLPDDRGLQPHGPHHVRDLPVPLRAAEHRLRGVPDVLRVLQAGVPGHLRPDDLAHGRRAARRPLPARRRAQAAGQGGRPPRHRRRDPRVDGRRLACSRRCATDGGGEWVADWERTADPWFLVATDPGHPGGYTHRHVGQRARHPARLGARVHRRAPGRRDDRPSDRGGARRARPDRGRVPRSAGRRGPRRLRGDARSSRGSCSSTSRSTCSTSSTGCGRRSGPSPTSCRVRSPRWASSTSRRTCSSCAAPRSWRRSTTCVADWSVGRPAARRRLLAPDRRAAADDLRRPQGVGGAARARHPADRGVRAVHGDALGHHDRRRPGLARNTADGDGNSLRGQPAGRPAWSRARRASCAPSASSSAVQEGDVLVCPATSPAWSPVFSRIAATVSDVGGDHEPHRDRLPRVRHARPWSAPATR